MPIVTAFDPAGGQSGLYQAGMRSGMLNASGRPYQQRYNPRTAMGQAQKTAAQDAYEADNTMGSRLEQYNQAVSDRGAQAQQNAQNIYQSRVNPLNSVNRISVDPVTGQLKTSTVGNPNATPGAQVPTSVNAAQAMRHPQEAQVEQRRQQVQAQSPHPITTGSWNPQQQSWQNIQVGGQAVPGASIPNQQPTGAQQPSGIQQPTTGIQQPPGTQLPTAGPPVSPQQPITQPPLNPLGSQQQPNGVVPQSPVTPQTLYDQRATNMSVNAARAGAMERANPAYLAEQMGRRGLSADAGTAQRMQPAQAQQMQGAINAGIQQPMSDFLSNQQFLQKGQQAQVDEALRYLQSAVNTRGQDLDLQRSGINTIRNQIIGLMNQGQ